MHYRGTFKRRTFGVYTEKWQTILADLGTGFRVPEINSDMHEHLHRMFQEVQVAFGVARHTPGCDGQPGCHRRTKCRHNFYNYDATFRAFLLLLWQSGAHPQAADVLRCFPPLTGKRAEQFECDFRRLIRAAGWDWVRDEWVVV